jgi:hypothetical protein
MIDPSRSKANRSACHTQDNVRFRKTIQTMVADLDRDPIRVHDISQIHQKYQIKRRRFYDVINIFLALGCATRAGIDELEWHGRSRIFPELRALKARLAVDDYTIPLSRLFPSDGSVSVKSLTRSFLLLFAALRVEVLDLRKVSAFFSRGSGNYKSTLCKLYQVALILGALGITERTESPCEVRILPPFTQALITPENDNPWAIANLLNRPADVTVLLQARMQELHGIGE